MTRLLALDSVTVAANAAALAWYNAFLATGQEERRPLLYRTLSVEFYPNGVQFIATDGTLMLRTWAPAFAKEEEDANTRERNRKWPEGQPSHSVVLMDRDKFALGFINLLMAATKEMYVSLTLTIEEAPEKIEGEPSIGEDFSAYVLTLRALGQQLHCRLFEDRYPEWRALNLGLVDVERVPGLAISTRMLSTLGKLKNISALDLDFHGTERFIGIRGGIADYNEVRGFAMPMRRPEKEKPAEPSPDPRQTDIEETPEPSDEWSDPVSNGRVKVDGRWVAATPENMQKAAEHVTNGRRGRPGSDHD